MARNYKRDYPYVEAFLQNGHNKPSLIVLSSSFTSSLSGAAYAMARVMHISSAKESFHYILDEGDVYQLVPDNKQATFAEDPKNALSILICDDPSSNASRWEENNHRIMLAQLADLVAQLCLTHKIRPRFLNEAELSRWKKWRTRRRSGIVVMGFMSKGYWPEHYFLSLVKAHMLKHKLKN